jgi:DNA-binding SARP family transcriptional activator/predicted ATPase
MGLEVSLLGPPRLERDGEPVSFDTRKATALLAHLALAERPRSREALCELLWPGRDPDNARGALRRTLSTLRKAVGEEWLETAGDSVALVQRAGLELDVRRFRTLAADGASYEDLAAAVSLFRGELLEGFSLRDSPEFDSWQVAEADELRRELAAALRSLVGLLAARGEYGRAIAHARRWLELDPLHEPAHRELIRLYAWNGDRAAALGQYRDCVRTLSQELGVPPMDETAALFEQVSDGTLAPAPGALAAPARHEAPASARASAAGSAPSEGAPSEGALIPPAAGARAFAASLELPLVAREAELGALLDAHRAAAADGRLAVVEGEAGIGKTRLAGELVARATGEGAVVLAARCYDDEAGIPYGPVVELLRQALALAGPGTAGWADAVAPQRLSDASLLLPELAGLRAGHSEPLSTSGPEARTRLLEGLAEVLGAACRGPVPGVILVDDVHGADSATLDLLAYLGRRLRGRPLLLLIGWRSEGMPPGHRLRRLAADLARDGVATIVRLSRLDEEEVARLVRLAHPGAEPELARRVYLESEGLPLFVAEYLAALGAGEPAGELLPSGVRSLLGARLAGLGALAFQLLGAAAVIGRSFDLDTVREASGRSEEEAVGALEELVEHGIVRELAAPEPAYDFSHQKLRALVYDEIGPARRRLLHRRVAGALSGGPGDAERAALVAQHLRLAGDHAGAAERYRVAAEHAAALHAHADALEHLEAALALGYPDTAGLHERIGDLRTLLGDYGGALASYESAAAHADAGALAAIEHKLGNVHQRRGEWERADARFAAALEAAPAEEGGLRARIEADLSLTLHSAGRSADAAALAREARALAEAAADRSAEAQAHNILGVLARGGGDLELARSELERSLALAEELADPPARAAALNNLALVSRDAGDLDKALELTESALALCAAYGDRHREAALENNLADLHHAAGRADESMAHLKRAVAIFSEVGADEATRLPEIWKLVSW